ncbi:helix-turn-helix domain-containing protein [Streptomyces sp. NPDC008092]|uniref:helix-turn-helix domain-containing protein n=1 Tax=Streptomyces sp. NPDC008092 TaxID=3364808 RepID=UPI0036E00774
MTRWQPLPATLPREARHLVEQLRVLKGRTGLSLAGLARRTAYSKSSWQRYLSGDRLPPRAAAQVLCRLAGGDQGRLLALWELAEQAWPPGTAEPAAAATAEATAGATAGAPTAATAAATTAATTDGAAEGTAVRTAEAAVQAAVQAAVDATAATAAATAATATATAAAAAAAAGSAPAAEPPKSSAGQRRWRIAAVAASVLAALLAAGLVWALPRRAGDTGVARPGGALSRAGRSTRSARNRCP